jgi:hypothetical protein
VGIEPKEIAGVTTLGGVDTLKGEEEKSGYGVTTDGVNIGWGDATGLTYEKLLNKPCELKGGLGNVFTVWPFWGATMRTGEPSSSYEVRLACSKSIADATTGVEVGMESPVANVSKGGIEDGWDTSSVVASTDEIPLEETVLAIDPNSGDQIVN